MSEMPILKYFQKAMEAGKDQFSPFPLRLRTLYDDRPAKKIPLRAFILVRLPLQTSILVRLPLRTSIGTLPFYKVEDTN